MPREKRYDSPADRQKAYRERKAQDVDPDLPETQIDVEPEEPVPAGARSLDVLLALDSFAPLSEVEEQLVRDHFGYAASETRSRAERQRVADRIAAR